MAARSNKVGDIGLWVLKVIASCEHPLQIIGARHLVQNFSKILIRKGLDDDFVFYTRLLRDELENQVTSIKEINKIIINSKTKDVSQGTVHLGS